MKTKFDAVMQEVQEFTSFQPKEGEDTIRYLYKARELANYYDYLDEDQDKDYIARRVVNILKRSSFYKYFHAKEGPGN